MKTLTEKELIALIRSSRPEDKAALDEFFDTTPTMVANNLLYEIAEVKAPSKMTGKGWIFLLIMALAPVMSVSMTLENLHKGKSWWHSVFNTGTSITLMALQAFLMGWEKVKRYRGTEEALFLLSARNDIRALPLLIRHWRQHPTEAQREWNDRVEAEATRLLDENRVGTASAEWKTVRNIVTQIVQTKQKRTKRELQDITPGQAYLAAAILRVLARAGGAENGAVLKSTAELSADAERFPNRAFVSEAAKVCYGADEDPLLNTRQASQDRSVGYKAQADNATQELLSMSARKGNP